MLKYQRVTILGSLSHLKRITKKQLVQPAAEFHAGTRNPFVWNYLRIMEYHGSSNTAMHRVRLTWTMINISQNGWLNREIDDTPLDFWTAHGYPIFNHTHFKETRILNSSMYIPTSTSLSFFLVWCWFVVHVRCFILCVFPVMCSHSCVHIYWFVLFYAS